MSTSSLRWGRIVLGGFIAELILIAAVIPMRALGSSESAITVLAVAGSFVVFVPVAWWLARPVGRPMLHGAMMGAAAAALYIAIGLVIGMFVPDAPPAPFIYYVAHALKIAGGTTGGWLARRSVGATKPPHAQVA